MLDRRTYYLLDVYRRRLDFPALKKAAIEQQEKHNATLVLVEDKASGTQLIQELQADAMYFVQAAETLPGSDKVVRLHAQTVAFASGHVLLPKKALWLPDYLKELLAFPVSKFDDQVDSTTQALEYFTRVLRKLSIYDVL